MYKRQESLREPAQYIRRFMAMAYPGEKSSLSEHIARDSFLTALGDAELELQVREREPKDLDEAVASRCLEIQSNRQQQGVIA